MEKISLYISKLYRLGRIYLEKRLKKLDLSSGNFLFIICIYKHDGITQEHIANLLNMNKASVARVVMDLEKSNLITRIQNEKDKREYHVHLTTKGKKLYPKVCEILNDYNNIIINDLNDNETKILNNTLNKMIDNIRKVL